MGILSSHEFIINIYYHQETQKTLTKKVDSINKRNLEIIEIHKINYFLISHQYRVIFYL